MRLPHFLSGLSPVGETLSAIDGGIQTLTEAVDVQNARLCVASADDAGLALWEADYGLLPTADLAARRIALRAALAAGGTVTPAYLEELCVSLGGFDSGEVTEDFAHWAVTVMAVADGRIPDTPALTAALTRLCPAHLALTVSACAQLTGSAVALAVLSAGVCVELGG